ncbi:aspartate aminotransferase family protein [Mycolicibacterium wolinskyi]|uniref:aminotransferase family protein n=1 Tax=Mycolicibacterium wolinskyi TaxID=59750 RepID=UPI00391771D2
MSTRTFVSSDETSVLPRDLDRKYPLMVRGEGVWLFDGEGRAHLDAVGGGAMVTSLGYGVTSIMDAADAQARELAYVYNQQFSNPRQEELATRLLGHAPGMDRVHFVTGGSEADEMAIRLARHYHVDRGQPSRHLLISPAQAYHGVTAGSLAITGRPSFVAPYGPYRTPQLHVPPCNWRANDPDGAQALAVMRQLIEQAGPENVSAFIAEPFSGSALPAYSPPEGFWRGVDELRQEFGFLVILDEVVTGMGRTGTWFATEQLPLQPDIITTAKCLGAGYTAIGAVMCTNGIYEGLGGGSRRFELGHTWDGAPLPCAVALAVIDELERTQIIEHVRERGPRLRADLEAALSDCEMVREVRGAGYLLGIDYVDPRDGASFIDPALKVFRRIDEEALSNELLLYSTQATRDGYTGDQTLLSPAYVSSESELAQIVDRTAATVRGVEKWLKSQY